ncbi:MAG: hypothetical protein NTW94_02615 [Legionellales bacterium]|nr:hypothetical protein [Legionellales bacterium]
MPFDQTTCDSKGNLVAVTLFETKLAKFVLDHPHFYLTPYKKVIDGIENYLTSRPFLRSMLKCDARFDLPEHVSSLFSKVNERYMGIDSFDALRKDFNLAAIDYVIQLVNDECFPLEPAVKKYEMDETGYITLSPRFFTVDPSIVATRVSPPNPSRSPFLFSEENCGVKKGEFTGRDLSTHALGIVAPEFTPEDCRTYFTSPINPTGFLYMPDLESHVAQWLMKKHMPIVSGASGPTETMISRIFPLAELDDEDKKMLILAQGCDLVAHGHHSLGECLIVAEHLGFKPAESGQLMDYYQQAIPKAILEDADFDALMRTQLQDLISDMPLRATDRSPAPR